MCIIVNDKFILVSGVTFAHLMVEFGVTGLFGKILYREFVANVYEIVNSYM